MTRTLILGITETGKSTLAKKLCAGYNARNIHTIVCDPLLDPDWCASFQTANPDDFVKMFFSSRDCAVFIDESGDVVGRFPSDELRTIATRGRHWGHDVFFIAQRATQLSATVRMQCTRLYLFTSSFEDGKILAQEFNKPELRNCAQLKKGEFYACDLHGEVKKMRVF